MAKNELEAPCFAVLCTDDELDEHLALCTNSGFYIGRDDNLGTVRVKDCGAILLDAVHAADSWIVRLDAAYYRHPFTASDGAAPPSR